jgi:acetylornithine deacetylase/succinyl-diaminopimelate desuccinylase-like protein
MINSMLRDTVSPTVINGGTKDNVIPEKVEAVLDCRLLPGQDRASFTKLMQEITHIDEIHPIPDAVPNPSESSTDTELYEVIKKVIGKHDAAGVVVPLLTSGVTDSRFFRQKGITAYGFNPLKSKISPDDYLTTAHGIDERIPIDNFDFGMECMYDIVAEMAL